MWTATLYHRNLTEDVLYCTSRHEARQCAARWARTWPTVIRTRIAKVGA